ncbi:FAD-dependent oxidoreductase [Streptomyces ficellus]|uniref:FAD-dependent oxidoreductase n=1 Tax=Streptomyces ficellus TaxID=1977088 RepID=A0A6I6FCL7_9ACTN|nr:hypothetical protein [Streptomyces ficellus]QGV76895.1 hypothetical protein EIZ62_00390 [Streptomyces ficellus]
MQRAVVLGGSIAGLLAARVLSDHAEDVVVVEPDAPDEEGGGRGAPHRGQLHALLSMGQTQLERWFPDFTQELLRSGARLGTGGAVRFYVDGRLKAPVRDISMIGASRTCIENLVRKRVLALPNVRIHQTQARDLVLNSTRVTGVRVSATTSASAGGHDSGSGELAADLVVDAMGRSSRLDTWLTRHGWDPARLDRMRIDLGYATATFRRGTELPDTVVAHCTPGPASGYQPTIVEPGALTAIEGDRWSVVLAGYAHHAPGADREEFLARMRRCAPPLREVAERCAPDSEIKPYRFPEARRRTYTSLGRFPGGLVVVGDALASVNPIYGQGMTLATLQASSLAAHLRSGARPYDPALAYFRRAETVVNAAWQLSSTADLAQPHVTGPYPRGYAFLRWAGDRITEASVRDSQVNQAFMDVVHMRAHPRTLTSPRILLRTARVIASRP